MTTRKTAAPATPMAPIVVPFMTLAAFAATWFGLPGLPLVWLGLVVAAFQYPAPELTGRKDDHGRATPANLSEQAKLGTYQFWSGLKARLISPGTHWLPGWPPLVSWLLVVLATALSFLIPVGPLDWASSHVEAQHLDTVTAYGRYANAAATFLTGTALAMALRLKAGPDCPGTRLDSLATHVRQSPTPRVALSVAATAVVVTFVFTVHLYAPDLAPVVRSAPAWAWVLLAISTAIAVHFAAMRELSLDQWRTLVAARSEWLPRWESVKLTEPTATLISRTSIGAVTIDTFEAPPSRGAVAYLGLAAKLAPSFGGGHTVIILGHPLLGPDGTTTPGSTDPRRFRVLDFDGDNPVDLTDPGLPLDTVTTVLEARMAQVTDRMKFERAPVLDVTALHAPESPRAAYRATFAGLPWATLRPSVASLPPVFGTQVLLDHRNPGLYVGALLDDPAQFADPTTTQTLTQLALQDHWNIVWGAASLARHKASQPTVSHGQCTSAELADGTRVSRVAFVTRRGIPPTEYFGREAELASALDSVPFVAITGFAAASARPGERHPQGLCVYYASTRVPATLQALAPVPHTTVPSTDQTPAAAPRRRPRPASTRDSAPHWVIAGMMNAAFEAAKLKRPEVVAAHCLTQPSPSGPHLWKIQLRLHEGVTLSAVRSAADNLRQHLGAPWLRVAEAADGVTLYAGADPARARLVNPVTDTAALVGLDWEQAFLAAGLVGSGGRLPELVEAGQAEHNENVQLLDFRLPEGFRPDTLRAALKTLKATTGNAFLEIQDSTKGARFIRLVAAKDNPLPFPAPMDYDMAVQLSGPDKVAWGVGVDGSPVSTDFLEGPHVLLVGPAGSGKSASAASMLWSATAAGMRMVVIDVQKRAGDYRFMWEHCAAVATELDAAAALMKSVYDEGVRRVGLYTQHGYTHAKDLPDDIRPPRLIVFIDEFTSLMLAEKVPPASSASSPEEMHAREELLRVAKAKNQIGYYAGKIAREHRSARVSLILVTQKMTGKIMDQIPGGNDLKDNLARILLGPPSQGLLMASLRNPNEPADLGSFIPQGRGQYESMSATGAVAIQFWYGGDGSRLDAGPGSLHHELATRLDPVAEQDRIDYTHHLPKDPAQEFGPPPGFGDEAATPEPEVVDLGDLDGFTFDLDDLEDPDEAAEGVDVPPTGGGVVDPPEAAPAALAVDESADVAGPGDGLADVGDPVPADDPGRSEPGRVGDASPPVTDDPWGDGDEFEVAPNRRNLSQDDLFS